MALLPIKTECHIRIAYQRKTSFNLDSIKQAQEIILTRKISEEDHSSPDV